MRNLTRREFLAGATATGGAMALGSNFSSCSPPFLGEGIYTDRSTYRHGEDIAIHLALLDAPEVEVTVQRMDKEPWVPVVKRFTVTPSASQRQLTPGILGADFEPAVVFPASDLEPGAYSVRIPQEAMRPGNRESYTNPPSGGFSCRNYIALFLVNNAVPGSSSSILYLADSLNGTAYGSYGGSSIYGSSGVKTSRVSYQRPGLDRGTESHWRWLRFMREHGYDPEVIDYLRLAEEPIGFLDDYDFIVNIGKFEYVPHQLMVHLDGFLAGGGNLFTASDEFAIFRVRLDFDDKTMTTYKYDFETEDPYWNLAPQFDAHVAGVGMSIPGTIYETQIIGQSCWMAHHVTWGTKADLPLADCPSASWILDGTGLMPGDVVPEAVSDFESGNFLDFDDFGQPFIVDHALTRTPPETQVWAYLPSDTAKAWWMGAGPNWPTVPGWATATYQERASGARVVTLPSQSFVRATMDHPVYYKIFENILRELS